MKRSVDELRGEEWKGEDRNETLSRDKNETQHTKHTTTTFTHTCHISPILTPSHNTASTPASEGPKQPLNSGSRAGCSSLKRHNFWKSTFSGTTESTRIEVGARGAGPPPAVSPAGDKHTDQRGEGPPRKAIKVGAGAGGIKD